jgi:hypothetical protein
MGRVYRVRHRRLGTALALKLLHGDHAADREVIARLRREAAALGALRHPHIISVVDAGTTEAGLAYLVMELATGRTSGRGAPGGPVLARASQARREPDRLRLGRGSRARVRAPRPEAPQRLPGSARRRRVGQGPRLWPRADRRSRRGRVPDPLGDHVRDPRLHGSRAGGHHRRRAGGRRVRAGRHHLRDDRWGATLRRGGHRDPRPQGARACTALPRPPPRSRSWWPGCWSESRASGRPRLRFTRSSRETMHRSLTRLRPR